MEEMNNKVLERLKTKFAGAITDAVEFRSELTVIVPRERIVEVCRFLKEDPDLCFDLLADLCGIDMATSSNRFGVIYNLYSYRNKFRMRLKTFTEEDHPKVPTVTGVWGTANWHEREAFDMYGIIFDGHPDLRRIYMPDEFEYHPLRKDFPLMGIRGSLELPKK
ncbi:MAG: NADH-quinone oxidoreductase subunit C [Ignavibacteriae bacterium]|nr:MAG: NADH-quinone oxidoreductase subunit C [Ignavibacteriota bacterium]